MKRILLVEDSPIMADIINTTLKRSWFNADIAHSLSWALEKITLVDYDVVITDTSLSTDSFSTEWLEVADSFISINPVWKVIAMSWMSRDEWIEWKNCHKFVDKWWYLFAKQILEVLSNIN